MVGDKDKKASRASGSDPKERDAAAGSAEPETEPTEPVVRDKRRIDPKTGEAREAHGNSEQSSDELTEEDMRRLLDEPSPSSDAASEHLGDLKRVQAEYANYRKRVDRDRFLARELAIGEIMTGILPVLDDLDLAHAHGDLEGSPLELVAQKIRSIFGRYGLVQVGAVGDLFDPKLHEAIAQLPSKDATTETIADVVQSGYQLGDRLLRPAKVAVSIPEE